MAEERKLIQLQGFAKLEYKEGLMEITLLGNKGDFMYEGYPLKLPYNSIRYKHVFKIENGVTSVEFINVLFDFDDESFKMLKDRTQTNDSQWATTSQSDYFKLSFSKDPLRPPYKIMVSGELETMYMDENFRLIKVDHVVRPTPGHTM